jgi:hypothetical protein
LALSQSYAPAAAILLNELDARRFNGGSNFVSGAFPPS